MHELKSRGVSDVLVAVVDGLKGFQDAIEAVFPDATVQSRVRRCLDIARAWSSGVRVHDSSGGSVAKIGLSR